MLTPEQIQTLCAPSRSKLDVVRVEPRSHGSALVAFSGVVNSTCVRKIATERFGGRALALTSLSASVVFEDARELATKPGTHNA